MGAPHAAHIRQAILKAVAIAGSEVKLAAACGVSQPAISKAKHQGKISARLALRMHFATNGRVSASELRPDLWRSPENVPIADPITAHVCSGECVSDVIYASAER